MSHARDARTRSPRGHQKSRGRDSSEEISRSVAGFGRYPNKRPPGLAVDASGSVALKNLMKAWGHKRGFSESDILQAVRDNMFVDGTTLRFAIDKRLTADGEDVVIRVMPKRDRQIPEAEPGAPKKVPVAPLNGPVAWKRLPQADGQHQQRVRGATRGRRRKDAKTPHRRDGGSARGDRPPVARSTSEKLDMSLGDLIADEGAVSAATPPKGARPAALNRADGRRRHGGESDSASPSPARGDAEMGVEPEASGTQHFFIGDDDSPPMEGAGEPKAPAPPPGAGWEKFQDDGMVWWYFKGPPEWWCQDDTRIPQLYKEAE